MRNENKEMLDYRACAYNEQHECKIISLKSHAWGWSTYELEEKRELCIDVNPYYFTFAKSIIGRELKYISEISECFELTLVNEQGDTENVFCIFSEPLLKDSFEQECMKEGIFAFRKAWNSYFNSQNKRTNYSDDDIESIYARSDKKARSIVMRSLKTEHSDAGFMKFVQYLDAMLVEVKSINKFTRIYLHPDNFGCSNSGQYKITNVNYPCPGFGHEYTIKNTRHSIAVTYSPTVNKIEMSSLLPPFQLLCPIWVESNDGQLFCVKAQLDTGAETSGFTKNFFEFLSMKKTGDAQLIGVTGKINTITSYCDILFPNGYKIRLNGCMISEGSDGVCLLIGMDILRWCRFLYEPMTCGYRYKLTFLS